MSQKPNIRFKGFSDDWEQRKLGEVVEFYNGDRSSRYPSDTDMVSDGIPFINAGDLVSGRVKLDTANKITVEKYNELSGAKIQHGDIIYCLRGTLGKNAFVDNFSIGTVASSLVDIRPRKIVGKYLFQVLNSDIEYRQRTINDEGAAQPRHDRSAPARHGGEPARAAGQFAADARQYARADRSVAVAAVRTGRGYARRAVHAHHAL